MKMKQMFVWIVLPVLFLGYWSGDVIAQQQTHPIKWQISAVRLNEKEAKLIFTCTLDNGWHIYSQFMEDGGPMPTKFSFTPDRSYVLRGKVIEESKPVKKYDGVFMMATVWYEDTVVFSQHVELNAAVTTIKGKIEFMGCNGEVCLLPNAVDFSMEVKAAPSEKNSKGK